MPRVIFAALLVVAALTQSTLLPMASGVAIKPDLVLVLLLLWSASREPREGLIWAFGAGLLLDLLALAPLGTGALILLPVVAVGWLSRSRPFQSGLVVPLALALVATIGRDLMRLAVSPLLGGYGSPLGALRLMALGALLNMLIVPPFYVLTQLLDRWIERNEAHARA